jgi:hypothetical protein
VEAVAAVTQRDESIDIARCPEHGLQGERQGCFICGGPVEPVAMVPEEDIWGLREENLRLWEVIAELEARASQDPKRDASLSDPGFDAVDPMPGTASNADSNAPKVIGQIEIPYPITLHRRKLDNKWVADCELAVGIGATKDEAVHKLTMLLLDHQPRGVIALGVAGDR